MTFLSSLLSFTSKPFLIVLALRLFTSLKMMLQHYPSGFYNAMDILNLVYVTASSVVFFA